MTELPIAADRDRDAHLQLRWDIWIRAFRFRLLPPRPVLHRLILERDALGTQLWDAVMRPALADRIPGLFAAGADPAMRRIAMDLRRVGASAYAVTGSLYLLHGSRPQAARTAGVATMWLAQAAAVIDYLLDEEAFPPAALAAHLRSELIDSALPAIGAAAPVHHFDTPPFDPRLTFVLTALERGFAGLRDCLAGAPDDPHHRRLRDELVICLREMVGAELDSPALRLASGGDLDAVDRTLRRVNTLSVWLFAYAGLIAEPALPAPVIDAVARIAELVGHIGWTLDALDDILRDLDAGVWNRAWLLLAQTRYRHRPTEWRALIADRELAIAELIASPVIDRLLASIEQATDEILANPAVPAEARAQLVDVCGLLVWSFLAPREPRPEPVSDAAPRSAPDRPTGIFFEDDAPAP